MGFYTLFMHFKHNNHSYVCFYLKSIDLFQAFFLGEIIATHNSKQKKKMKLFKDFSNLIPIILSLLKQPKKDHLVLKRF
jgi:hypothetical protein